MSALLWYQNSPLDAGTLRRPAYIGRKGLRVCRARSFDERRCVRRTPCGLIRGPVEPCVRDACTARKHEHRGATRIGHCDRVRCQGLACGGLIGAPVDIDGRIRCVRHAGAIDGAGENSRCIGGAVPSQSVAEHYEIAALINLRAQNRRGLARRGHREREQTYRATVLAKKAITHG